MKLDRLILNNFLTFDHLDYEFEQRPLLIQGENLTDDSQKTNGTGKSGLQTAIEFCITSSFSGYEQLVTYGKEEGSAELYASCEVRKEEIHIYWDIRVKGSNKLTVEIQKYDSGDWIQAKFSNVNDGKKFIIDWFAISKEDISNYFIINNSRFKSFFKSSNKEKVDLINRFSDASIIKGLEDIDISELEDELRDAEGSVQNTNGKVELIDEQIQEEKDRDFKEELLEKSEELDLEIEDLQESIDTKEDDIRIENNDIEGFKDKIKSLKLKIVDYKENTKEVEDEVKSTKEIIDSIEYSLNDANEAFKDFYSTDWDSKREVFEDNLDDSEHELTDAKNIQTKRDNQETKILKFLQEIEVKLAGAITCPKCSHEFSFDCDIHKEYENKNLGLSLKKKIEESKGPNNVTIALLKSSIKKIEDKISAINKLEQVENSERNELSTKINNVTEKLNIVKRRLGVSEVDLRDIENNISRANDKIESKKKSISNAKDYIKGCDKNIKQLNKDIKHVEVKKSELKIDNNTSHINTLENTKSELGITLEIESTVVSKIGDKIYLQNQWINNFKQFRTFLANKSLEIIQFHCNRFLNDMGSDLRVKMEGYKVLASGKIKEEITAKIIRDNTERTFASFSGGERGRLLFASILANRQMINDTHPYGGFDFLAVDEVFEGVDSLGLQSLINSIKSLEITVMIVTHVSSEDESNDILTIIKENGISRIKK